MDKWVNDYFSLNQKIWQEDASCIGEDPDIFFPDEASNWFRSAQYTYAAKAICRGCVVREDCLTYAEALKEEHGVWGGLTVEERLIPNPTVIQRANRALKFAVGSLLQ